MMNPSMWRIFAAAFVLMSATRAHGQENVTIKSGDGRETVESYCATCHSLQYLPENGFLSRQAWELEVTKMIKTFGAPIEPADAKVIIDYLSANYGSGN
jgi:sulfite dehydrogenase (cytochrome) subunit B